MFLGAYAVFAVVRRERTCWTAWLARLAPMGLMILFMAGGMVLHIHTANTRGIATEGPQSVEAQWNFCTSWSVPPQESLDFIAPGFYGWRTSEPAGPYWGETGQSAEWPTTGRGFRNFRLETVYLGAIPFLMAIPCRDPLPERQPGL